MPKSATSRKPAKSATSSKSSPVTPRAKRTRKKAPIEDVAPSLTDLEALRQGGVKKHAKAANTQGQYQGRIDAARIWLTAMVAERKAAASSPPQPDLLPPEPGPGVDDEPDPFDDPRVANTFDPTPNELTPRLIALYLTYKGFHQKLKFGTIDGIRAAFKNYYKNATDDRKYEGTWGQHPITREWVGNPVDSGPVEAVWRSLKNYDGQDDGESVRNHSVAMSKEYMEEVFACMDALCPPSDYFNPNIPMGSERRNLITSILSFKAFASTGWTVWTRNFELIKLRERHLTLGLTNPDAFNTPYFEIHLTNRKGWQNKNTGEADLRSGKYKISDQPLLPACNAYHWLLLWRRYLQEVVYGRDLQPDDFLFPAIGANGIVQVGVHISHEDVQKAITHWTSAAKLPVGAGKFTTHCFRRGGAQYRFMFAPVGRRWTLRQVRWWGGWAEGEHRDTLIKYLLDELQTYEEDCSGLLFERQPKVNESFLGEAASVANATLADLQMHNNSMHSALRNISQQIASAAYVYHPPPPPPPNLPGNQPQMNSHLYFQSSVHPTNSAFGALGYYGLQGHIQASNLALPIPAPAQSPPERSHLPTPPAPASAASSVSSAQVGQGPHVPDIPVMLADRTRSPDCDSWRYVVKHWLEGDPSCGLDVPLQSWPSDWTRGPYRRNAMKYKNRQWIALEFINWHNRDEQSFLAAFPEAMFGLQKLLEAVNRAREARGERKLRKSRSKSP